MDHGNIGSNQHIHTVKQTFGQIAERLCMLSVEVYYGLNQS